MTTYVTTFVVVCAMSNYMWLYDYVVDSNLSLLPSNHKCGHNCKCQFMIFAIVVMPNIWLHIWLDMTHGFYLT